MKNVQNTGRVLKKVASEQLNNWLLARGYQVAYYDQDNANFTVVMLGTLITALNYSPKVRKKYLREYILAKKLFSEVHNALRAYELRYCQSVAFIDLPSEKLRREIQKENETLFAKGLSDIQKYIENDIELKFVFTIGDNLIKKKKKKKAHKKSQKGWLYSSFFFKKTPNH